MTVSRRVFSKRVICPIVLQIAVIGGFALFVPTALAAGGFAFESSFGSEGTGNGGFKAPANVAVQQTTGDVFVADEGNARVQVFGSEGRFLTQITGENVPLGLGEVTGVAVDNSSGPSTGDVYVATRSGGVVDKFAPKSILDPEEGYEYICQITGPAGGCTAEGGTREFVLPSTVAVDGNGNVYVGQFLNEGPAIDEFGAEGGLIATVGPTTLLTTDIAVNATGSAVYVATGFGSVTKLTVDPATHSVQGETQLAEGEGAQAVTVDQATGDVFIDRGERGIREYEEAATNILGEPVLEEFGTEGAITHESLGIAYSTHGDGTIYITEESGDVLIYLRTRSVGPEAECAAPKEVRTRSAKLDCAVNPEGKSLPWHLEYREARARPVTWTTTPGGMVASAETVEEAIEQLKGETEYVYRVGVGSTTSAPVRFTTPPAVPGLTTCNASDVTGEHSTLEASLTPFEESEYKFEYGTSTGYGSVSVTGASAMSTTPVAVSEPAKGLEPNTEYDCRLSASDLEGTSNGPNGTFKTPLVRPAIDGSSLNAIPTRTTAVLRGTVNPEKSSTSYRFVYVAAAHYEPAAKNPYYAGGSTPVASAGGAFKDEAVESPQISGLRAGTTYDAALQATNEAGSEVGPNYAFTTAPPTPPVVSAGETVALTPTSAVISVAIDPEGLPATYEVDFGAGTADGGAKIFGQVIAGHEVITLALENLTPGTTYVYTALSTNEDGTSSGPPDQAFTTPAVKSTLPAIAQPPSPLLVATPPIAFPTELGKVIKPPKKKKPAMRKKRHHAKSGRKDGSKRTARDKQVRR